MEALVHVTRGELIECIHYGDIAIADASGDLIAHVGDPSRRIYWRSAAKPIQALTVIQSGAADRFEFTARELSLCCASHCGSMDHVETARSILAKIGLSESDLLCGTHMPGDASQREWLTKNDQAPLPIMNNCSGKHSGMLASTVAFGADPRKYLEIDSPVQQSILKNMSVLTDVAPQDMAISTDGCGAPVHGMCLHAMATAYARLCWPDDMPRDIQEASPRIIAAMACQPVMVSGEGSFNSELLAAYQGGILAKGGAEGLMTFGLTERGIGVAIRSRDGSARGQSTVVMEVLRQLDALTDEIEAALAGFIAPDITNCRGEKVGQIKPAGFELRE